MSEELQLKKLKSEYKEYYKNYSLLLTLGLIWLGAAYAGTFEFQLSILFLFLGITLFKPVLSVTSKLLRTPKVAKDESLKLLTKLIIIGILFGLIVGFFPFLENINLFFPAFTVIFGLIFGGIFVSTRLKVYATLSAALLAEGLYVGYYFPEDFTKAGFYAAYTMCGFGIFYGIVGKKAKIHMRFLKKRLRVNLKSIGTTTRTFVRKKARKAA